MSDVAIVTGATGSLGDAVAVQLAARGLRVVGWDRRSAPEPGRQFAAAERLDVRDDDAVHGALARATELGTVRYLFAAAGGNHLGELMAQDPSRPELSDLERSVGDNLLSAMICTSAVIPVLRTASGDRSITLVSSINDFGGFGSPGYSAAKAGLHGYATTVADILGPEGIRVNVVAPGTTNTQGARELSRAQGRDETFAAAAAKAPLRKVATAQDVATVIVALGVDFQAVTGQVVVADNGQMLHR